MVGNACIQLKDVDRTPYHIVIYAKLGTAYLKAAKQSGKLYACGDEALPEELRIILKAGGHLLQGDSAAAVDYIKDIDIDTELHIKSGVPVYKAAEPIDKGYAADAYVGKVRLNASARHRDVAPCGEQVKQCKFTAQNKGKRRDSGGHKIGLVYLIYTCAHTTDPEHAEGVDGDAGKVAANVEPYLIGHGDAVIAAEAELGLHSENLNISLAFDAYAPFPIHYHKVKGTAYLGHTVCIRG